MLCRFWQQGVCRHGDQCRFSHGDDVPTAGGGGGGAGGPAPQGAGQACTYFLQGGCRFGDACRYSHAGEPSKGGFGGKGGSWKGCGKGGQGKGKWTFDEEAKGKGYQKGPPPGAQGAPVNQERQLTGPYLGKGSELLKVWSMPDELGHEDAVDCAIVMTDRVCTGSRDQQLLVWRGEQGPTAGGGMGLALAQDSAMRFPSGVTALLFHAESKWLFCGLADGQIKAFRQEPLAEATLAGHAAPVTSLLVVESVLLSGSEDCTARAWKYDSAKGGFDAVATVQCPLGQVLVLHQVPGHLWLGAVRGVTCVSMETMQPVGNIEATAPVVGLLPYQGAVIAAFANGVVKVYDAGGKEQFSHGPLGEHTTNSAVALVKHPFDDKDLLLCGQEYGYVTVYEIPEFKPRGTFTTGYEGDVSAIVDMGGGSGMFVTCGQSGDVVLWRWQPGGAASLSG